MSLWSILKKLDTHCYDTVMKCLRLSIVDFECLKKGTNSREIIKAAKVMQMPSTLV